MASERERWVGHLDLFLHVKNRPADALDLAGGMGILMKQGVAGTTNATVSDARWIVQFADLKLINSGKAAAALFLGIDRERAAAVYGDIKTLNLRTAPKLDSEGGAVSAHLVIGMAPDK